MTMKQLSERMKQRLALFDKEESNPNAVPATYTEIEKWIGEVAQLEAENERLRKPFWVKEDHRGHWAIMIGEVDVVWYVLEDQAREQAARLNAALKGDDDD